MWEARGPWTGMSPRCLPSFPARHRACNMFLESYKAAWILTEDHSFEDRMIDDLSVSWGLQGRVGAEEGGTPPGVALHLKGHGNQVAGLGRTRGGCRMWGKRKKDSPGGLWGRHRWRV